MSHDVESRSDLNATYASPDPWGYENNPEDLRRIIRLKAALSHLKYKTVLDIGCGNGFISQNLGAETLNGFDISDRAIEFAQNRGIPGASFQIGSIQELMNGEVETPLPSYDLVCITGLLYPKWVGDIDPTKLFTFIRKKTNDNGHFVSVHIKEWTFLDFPFEQKRVERYPYRNFTHDLIVYIPFAFKG